MTPEELRAMLGIKPEVIKDKEVPIKEKTLKPKKGQVISPTALKLDLWDKLIGVQLKGARPEPELLNEDLADFHGAAYLSSPELVEFCENPRRLEFMKTLMETGDYRSLHETTQYDRALSVTAANKFADQWLELLRKDKKRDEKDMSDEKREGKAESDLFSAVAAALAEAEEEVGEEEEMEMSLFPTISGHGKGAPGSPLDPMKVIGFWEKIRGSAKLRRIFDGAGRFRRAIQSRQRHKVMHGADEMVGIELGANPARLLPSELALMAHPVTRPEMLQRFVESRCLQREFRGIEPVGKGPIVVDVDTSGSMQGKKEENAKAFGLGMAYLAQHQRRWCCLIDYSGNEKGNILVLQPGRWDHGKLLDWLIHSYGAGSSLDVPIMELPHWWKEIKAPKGKTDLFFITDAQAVVSDFLKEKFLAWKVKEKVKLRTLLIGSEGRGEETVLNGISDEVFEMGEIDPATPEVGECLSI